MTEMRTTPEATILVVDDNKNNLDLMLATLSEHNYRLLAATSGERAIKVASKVKPDLILMDIQMPEMDGFETTIKMKSMPEFAHIPILFLSALNDLKNIVKCFESGGVDYISKPFQKEELFARISTHLKIRKLQDEIESERDKISAILKNILPEKHISNLKEGKKPDPENVEKATILFTDFENFTGIAKDIGPAASVASLNEIFWAFDEITQDFGLERVKTIGDAYMAIGGVNKTTNHIEHATAAAGLKLQEFIASYNQQNGNQHWKLRVGVHKGPVIAGIIGYQKIAFDVWGHTINFAARLENAAETNGICVSEQLYQVIQEDFILKKKEVTNFHNIGEVAVYHITDFKNGYQIPSNVDVSKLIDASKDGESLLKKIFGIQH